VFLPCVGVGDVDVLGVEVFFDAFEAAFTAHAGLLGAAKRGCRPIDLSPAAVMAPATATALIATPSQICLDDFLVPLGARSAVSLAQMLVVALRYTRLPSSSV
jgi:hypothetical protein